METSNINIDNFFEATLGVWKEIKEVPNDYTLFYSTYDSKYFKSKDEDFLVRISGHWGSGIRECNWYLNGYARNNSFLFKKTVDGKAKIGIIRISDLKDLRIKESA